MHVTNSQPVDYSTNIVHGKSTFRALLPYAITSLVLATLGARNALHATSQGKALVGVAMGMLGVYSFFGAALCAVDNAGNPKKFKANVIPCMLTGAAAGVSEIILFVVKTVLREILINNYRKKDESSF